MIRLPPADVLWRAMSPTRMVDSGVAYADVVALRALTDAGTPWDEAGEHLADLRMALAAAAQEAGHLVTAHAHFRAAAGCLLFAQMAYNHDTPRKRELYRRFGEAVAAAADSAVDARSWEWVTLPHGEGCLHGWLIRPTGLVSGTVVVLGGQSGWGAAYLGAADALNARGLAAFLVEGPGQGQTRMEGGLLLDEHVALAYSRLVAHAAESVGGPVGLWGNSMGGLYAALTAAADPQVAALCVNGAPARPRLLGMRTFDEQAAAMVGTTDRLVVQQTFDNLTLAKDAAIAGAVLVLHGGQDPIVTLEEQRPFLDAAVGRADRRLWEDGEHTIYNHGDERTAFVADWFADRFAERQEG